ncbi:hypothetical protein L208DRAFT_1378761 [Tricholoma matsutake]|nr:hypothetical protein L208DRAFT_1378761 [Tricholoma matsutake 945]
MVLSPTLCPTKPQLGKARGWQKLLPPSLMTAISAPLKQSQLQSLSLTFYLDGCTRPLEAQRHSLTEVAAVEGFEQDHRGMQTMILSIDASFDIKKDGDAVTIFTEMAIQTKQDIQLTQGGMLLMALLGGGDYNMASSSQQLSPLALSGFLTSWRGQLQDELSTDKSGFLGQHFSILAYAVHNNFPNINIIYQYARPTTSWSNGQNGPNISPIFLSLPLFANAPSPGDHQLSPASFITMFERGAVCGAWHRSLRKAFTLHILQQHINNGVIDDGPPSLSSFLQIWKVYQVETLLCSLNVATQPHLTQPRSVPLTTHGDVQKMLVLILAQILERALPMLVWQFKGQVPPVSAQPEHHLEDHVELSGDSDFIDLTLKFRNKKKIVKHAHSSEEHHKFLSSLPSFYMSATKGLYTGPSGGKKPKISRKKKARNATSSLETLQKIKESSCAQHGHPKRTQDNYMGYVQRGKMFLEDLMAER